jgi:hypothetical protein
MRSSSVVQMVQVFRNMDRISIPQEPGAHNQGKGARLVVWMNRELLHKWLVLWLFRNTGRMPEWQGSPSHILGKGGSIGFDRSIYHPHCVFEIVSL